MCRAFQMNTWSTNLECGESDWFTINLTCEILPPLRARRQRKQTGAWMYNSRREIDLERWRLILADAGSITAMPCRAMRRPHVRVLDDGGLIDVDLADATCLRAHFASSFPLLSDGPEWAVEFDAELERKLSNLRSFWDGTSTSMLRSRSSRSESDTASDVMRPRTASDTRQADPAGCQART